MLLTFMTLQNAISGVQNQFQIWFDPAVFLYGNDAVLFLDGFCDLMDGWARAFTENQILVAIHYIIAIAGELISLPTFSYFGTFIIEERFGFNKTTKRHSFWIN
jgi:hypothetical protein